MCFVHCYNGITKITKHGQVTIERKLERNEG